MIINRMTAAQLTKTVLGKFACQSDEKVKDYSEPVLSDYLKIDKTKVLMESGSLMKVESIAECSLWPALSNIWY